MAGSSGVGGGAGSAFQAGLQRLLRAGQEALAKVRGGDKGADSKSEVKGDAKAGSTGGAAGTQAAKGKGKVKGQNLTGVEKLLAGGDDFALEDEDTGRRRRGRQFMGEDSNPHGFHVQDSTEDRSAVSHISAEYRGQVASGMAAGRSFTQGSCLVPDTPPDVPPEPAKKRK
jgi:hypothetical protein